MPPYANIHHFDFKLGAVDAIYDEDGDPMFGYYYEIVNEDGSRLSGFMGPYGDKAEAEAACAKEWERNY